MKVGLTPGLQALNLSRVATSFGLAIGLARWSYTPAQLAPYESLWVVYGLASFAFSAGLLQHVLSVVGGAPLHRKAALFGRAQRWTLQLAGFWGGLVAAVGWWTAGANGPDLLALFMAAFAAAQFGSLLLEYRLVLANRVRAMLTLAAGTALANLMAGLVGLYWADELWGLAAGLAAVNVLRLAAAVVLQQRVSGYARGATRSISDRIGRWQLRKAWPLVAQAAIGGSLLYLDSAAVALFLGEEDFVLFRYGSREFPLVRVLAAGVSSGIVIRLAQAGVGRRQTTERSAALATTQREIAKLCHLTFPLTLLLMVFAEPVFRWVYGEAYVAAVPVFQWLLLVTLPRLVFPQSFLVAAHRNRDQLLISLQEWWVHLVLVVLLLPFVGLVGAAIAAVAADLLEKVLLFRKAEQYQLGAVRAFPWWTWSLYSLLLVGAFVALQVGVIG